MVVLPAVLMLAERRAEGERVSFRPRLRLRLRRASA
jgi:hypothetical protein